VAKVYRDTLLLLARLARHFLGNREFKDLAC